MFSGPTALVSSAVSFDAGAVRDSQPRGLEVNCANSATDRPTIAFVVSTRPSPLLRSGEKIPFQWRRSLAGPEPDPSLRSTN
ncbi:unnamed protein product [Sphagnum jensenii]|uniref:Uncharacterized protein n=1 Tax=Sphagnum jensenii TaxID=128206 RepID=A0ABP1AKX2_9BRYO